METWRRNRRNGRRLQAGDMKFLRALEVRQDERLRRIEMNRGRSMRKKRINKNKVERLS